MTQNDTLSNGVENVETYRRPDMGEKDREKDLPLGWIADHVEPPESWVVEFVDRGTHLRFRRKVDRKEYGLKPPGYPGVGIVSGWDYWHITADTDRVLHPEGDLWHDNDDDPTDVLQSVEAAIEAVSRDLERCRLSVLLDGAHEECLDGENDD